MCNILPLCTYVFFVNYHLGQIIYLVGQKKFKRTNLTFNYPDFIYLSALIIISQM
jgi:hypothetical protein